MSNEIPELQIAVRDTGAVWQLKNIEQYSNPSRKPIVPQHGSMEGMVWD
jgi:hypothetical protein